LSLKTTWVISLIFYSNLQETIIVPFYYFIFDTLV